MCRTTTPFTVPCTLLITTSNHKKCTINYHNLRASSLDHLERGWTIHGHQWLSVMIPLSSDIICLQTAAIKDQGQMPRSICGLPREREIVGGHCRKQDAGVSGTMTGSRRASQSLILPRNLFKWLNWREGNHKLLTDSPKQPNIIAGPFLARCHSTS